MADAPGSAQGRYFVDTGSEARVRFKSESDAMLASFLFGGKTCPRLLLSTFNDLLRLLRNPLFRPEDVSFSSEEDVLLEIADSRRQTAYERSLPRLTALVTAGIPKFIMDIVAEANSQQVRYDAHGILHDNSRPVQAHFYGSASDAMFSRRSGL
ncbi:hypothetical protein DFH11DRAFT_1731172 [Phellopilus nigrolimitatus]|nr:hypothetical protein DFH11DRAFT_1731172 [Phellopilus nigrolimitatus]